MIKADLHIHSEYSMDSDNSPENIINRCLKLGINCIAICDHGTAEGGIKLKELAPFKVIVAEEILTPRGEITGMFLKETIPSGLSVDETIARIKDQDALVCIPHPVDIFRKSALDTDVIERLAREGKIDLIEVLNARTLLKKCVQQSEDLSRKYSLPGIAGSDAHSIAEIGTAYIEMPDFNGRNDFLDAVSKGKICGHRTGPLVHFHSFRQRFKSSLKKGD